MKKSYLNVGEIISRLLRLQPAQLKIDRLGLGLHDRRLELHIN